MQYRFSYTRPFGILILGGISFIIFICAGRQPLHAQKQPLAEEVFQQAQQSQDSAIFYYHKAYELAKNNGDTLLLLKSLNMWGQQKLRKQDFKEVKALLGAQLEGIAYGQSFGVAYFDLLKTYNNSLRALNAYQQILKVVDELIELSPKVHGKDNEEMVDLLMTKGLMLGNLGIRDQARENLTMALNLSIKLYGENSMETAEIYNNIGLVFRSINDYDAAMLYYSKTYDIVYGLEPENYYVLSIIKNNISRIYDQKGESEKALELVNEAIALNERSGQSNPSLFNNRGLILVSLKDYERALENYDKALSIRKSFMPQNHPQIAYSHSLIGEANLKSGNIEIAEENFLEALEILKSREIQSWDRYFIYMGLGDVAMKKSAPSRAIEYYNQAIGYFFPESHPKEAWENPDIQFAPYNYGGIVISEALIKKGDALLAMQDEDSDVVAAEKALACYMSALEAFKKQINAATSEDIKFSLSETGQKIYASALKVAQRLYQLTGDKKYASKGFEIMEANKAYVLYQNLKSMPAGKKLLPNDLRNQYAILSKKTDNYKKSYLDLKKEGEKTDDIRDSIIATEKQLDELNARVRKEFPRYFDYWVSVTQPELSMFQSVLGDNALALLYYEWEQGYFVLAISKHKVVFKYIDNTSPDQLQLETANLEDYKVEGYSAYNQLIKPFVREFPEVDHLTIIPDGKLNEVPFEALLIEEADEAATFSSLPYLLRKYTVSYNFSASLIVMNFLNDTKRMEGNMLAYAPSFSKSSGPLLATRSAADSALVKNLPLLPMAEKEAKHVALLYNTEALVGSDATEADFKKRAPLAHIIHLASHAIVDHENPLYSKLVFSPGKDTVEDGLLHTYELYNMTLNADLVSLSACNTGIGKYYAGEGPMSLARGFMYAGTPNVMMSLWSVPDQSTSTIMQSFYGYLKEGMSKPEALRKAKLDYLSTADANTAAPYFWSGFVFIGKPEVGQPKNDSYIYAGAGGILLLIGTAYFYSRRRNGRS